MFTPHVEKLVAPDVLERFRDVKTVVGSISDVVLPSGRPLSCHMVCRIVSRRTGIEFKDGYFGVCTEHSWLVYSTCIIDVYPVGALDVPILFETEYMLPWGRLYREEELKTVCTEEFRRDMEYLYSLYRRGSE